MKSNYSITQLLNDSMKSLLEMQFGEGWDKYLVIMEQSDLTQDERSVSSRKFLAFDSYIGYLESNQFPNSYSHVVVECKILCWIWPWNTYNWAYTSVLDFIEFPRDGNEFGGWLSEKVKITISDEATDPAISKTENNHYQASISGHAKPGFFPQPMPSTTIHEAWDPKFPFPDNHFIKTVNWVW